MTALVEGTWTTIGTFALVAAAVSLAASLTFLGLTWHQDQQERTRERRLSVEETAAEIRRQDSKVGLALAVVAILVVVVLSALGL